MSVNEARKYFGLTIHDFICRDSLMEVIRGANHMLIEATDKKSYNQAWKTIQAAQALLPTAAY